MLSPSSSRRNGLRATSVTGPFSLLACLLLLLVAAGCGKSTSQAPAKQAEGGSAITGESLVAGEATPESQKADKEKSPWIGRWKVVLTEQNVDFYPFLLEIAEFSGKRGLRVLDVSSYEGFKDWEIAGASFQGDDKFLLGFKPGKETEQVLIFVGTIYEDDILGVVTTEEFPIPKTARLVKTADTSLRKQEPTASIPGTEVLAAALKAQDPAALKSFIESHPNNPLTFNAYEAILSIAVQKKAPADEIEKIVQDMTAAAERWGIPMKADAHMQVISQAEFKPAYRSIVENSLQESRKLFGEEIHKDVDSRLKTFEAQFLLTSEKPEDKQAGLAQVQNILKENPFEMSVVLSLAKHYELAKEKEEALKIYTRLAVLPGLSQMLGKIEDPLSDSDEKIAIRDKARSYFEGSDEEFEKHLSEAYQREAYDFVTKRTEPLVLPENRRVPLVELFTGAMCPPCVSPDLVVGGLEKVFPLPEMVAVRYHQHVPGPDPLANSSSESRYNYYNCQGTPALFVNGQPISPAGGYVMHAKNSFEQLLPYVTTQLGRTSAIKIDLKSEVKDETITVQASASGISKARNNIKLRLLLVEPSISFMAQNGIRVHEMVVRDLPGGSAGITAKEGEAKIEASVNVAELRKKLQDELKSLEENRNYKFNDIPGNLDQLLLIAFVQDDTSKEVLQATSGELMTFGKAPAASDTAAPKTEAPKTEAKGQTKEAEAKKAEPAAEKPATAADKPADKPADAEAGKAKTDQAAEKSDKAPAEETKAEPPAATPEQQPAAATEN